MNWPPKLAFLDTETTGLDPSIHEMIEVGIIVPSSCMPLIHRANFGCEWSSYETKVVPEHIDRASPAAIEISGYSPDSWLGAESSANVARRLVQILENVDIVVGHNVWFDCNFITAMCERNGITPPAFKYCADTITLTLEHLVPLGAQKVNLGYVCDVLGVSNDGAHSALPDARRAKAVYEKLQRPSMLRRALWKYRIRKMSLQ